MSNCFKPDRSIAIVVGVLTVIAFSLIGLAESGGPVNNEELYKLLGVSKKSTTREIRIAFKKLALEKHPDKNKDNPNANEEFIRINRAYEILKDDDLRKKYDLYGEDGLKENQNQGNSYQSWNFYKQNFGIYDDDPEIQTLSRSDFMQAVDSSSDTIWFINFYSTQCSHCHDLAPTWRELAKQLDGVIKIGAVNCMDDWMLCNEQQIQSFPSLIMYPKRERFMETKTIDSLLKFALSFASGNVYDLSTKSRYEKQLKKTNTDSYLVTYCLSSSKNFDERDHDEELNYELNCLEELVQQKLAIMLHGLVKVAHIDCNKKEADENICSKLKPKWSAPIILYNRLPELTDIGNQSIDVFEIKTTDYKKIAQSVLSHLPDVTLLSEDRFKNILEDLRQPNGEEKPWLIEFVNEFESNENLELKKLPFILSPDYNFGVLECSKLIDPSLCELKFQINKFPTFILFKSARSITGGPVSMIDDNWYEIYYTNRVTVDDLASFVKMNAHSTVRTLTRLSADFISQELASQQKLAFFVDFFAPWCPPCMNLLPEFRKASRLDGSKRVLFATIDCTTNQRLCEQYGVRSYPTTILFNGTEPNSYLGFHRAQDISDFIDDILSPVVVNLNYEMFYQLVGQKPIGKIWLIDWFASWCGPCQQLAPEWRKMAKKVDAKLISVGQVDCVVEQRLCAEQGVQSYPNIRIYPASTLGISRFEMYQGWMRDANSILVWALNYVPSVAYMLDVSNFEQLVLRNFLIGGEQTQQEPWLVDFYAPWCGHCQVFAPVFESLAQKLKGRVKCGKVNCEEQQYLCQMAGIRAYPTIRFYPISNSNQVNWNSGMDIHFYDLDSIMRVVNDKLDEYGYKTNEDFTTKFHSEL